MMRDVLYLARGSRSQLVAAALAAIGCAVCTAARLQIRGDILNAGLAHSSWLSSGFCLLAVELASLGLHYVLQVNKNAVADASRAREQRHFFANLLSSEPLFFEKHRRKLAIPAEWRASRSGTCRGSQNWPYQRMMLAEW